MSTVKTSAIVDIAGGNTVTINGDLALNQSTNINRGVAVASTSGSAIDFTDLPSWVTRITIIFSGVSTSGTSGLAIQIGDSGGIETTGYVAGVSSIQGTNATAAASSTTAFLTLYAAVAGAVYNGIATIVLIDGNTWICTSKMGQNNGLGHFGYGSKTLSSTLDRVRLITGVDSFDAGTINILWE